MLESESPLKVMKNAYFTLKALFVLKIFRFLSWPFGHVEKRLDSKDKVSFKIEIHIFPNISRSKGNQTTKFGHLIEYKMKNIFLEKSYTKYDSETIPILLSTKSKLSISLDQ